ncbi:MAG TPA: response regulator, partial [Methylomirabilota bacterium]|nr:response regulator [Methylomirabilota bacterium]
MRVAWPVLVDDGRRFVQAEAANISPYGVKLLLRDRLQLGAQVRLSFTPSERAPFDLEAIVWRLDADGPALIFLGTHHKDFPFPAVSAESGPEPSAAPGAAATVLLVEDDPGIRALARDVLEAAGHTVLDAGADPVKAVRLAREHAGPIDILLTDVVMPLMDGPHLVERLAPLRPKMKVIFMSAYRVTGVSATSAHFLLKPFTREAL